MNYKDLFRRLFTLIGAPKKAWVEISAESPRRDVTSTYVYPLIALCGLAVLLSAMISDGMQRPTFQSAMMDICRYCVALFGGFFLAAYLVDILRQKLLQHPANMSASQLFVGYAMGVVYFAEMLALLFPQFFLFKWMLMVYIIYIVWEGSEVVFAVEEGHRMMFTALASVSIIFSPALIRMLFNMLSNTLV